MTETYRNFIAGDWVEAESGEWVENRNPARTSELIGRFPISTAEEVDRAVASARRGFETWRDVPAPERGLVLQRAGEMMAERKEELARHQTREMGKVLEETMGDVQEAIDTAFYAAGEGRRLFGKTVPSELPDK